MQYHNTLIFCLFIYANNTYAERLLIGATYSVDEVDALSVIEEKANKVNWEKKLKKINVDKTFNKMKTNFSRTEEDNIFTYTPYYVLENEIPDKDGNTLYPKGFKYNPLDYFYMPGRIIVIGETEADILWLKKHKKRTDRIITTGNIIRELKKYHDITAFKFTKEMPERLGIRHVPSIILQEDNHFIIEEVKVEDEKVAM